jgi:DNA-binding NarL/FixJ family response regulator
MSRKRVSQSTRTRHRVVIVDDHPLVRRGLKALINAEPDLIVSAEAATVRKGLEAVVAERPELVIVDLSLGESDGLDLVRAVRARRTGPRVLVLSMHEAPHYVKQALDAGAQGYVAKREMTETLLIAIRAVLRGQTYGLPGS